VEDERYIKVNNAQVSASIRTPAGERFDVPMEWTVDKDGEYRASFLPEGKGLYEITVEATDRAGNHASDSVTVVYRAPEEPKKEEPKKEEPKEDKPSEDKPKEEQPKEQDWEFSAHQTYGQCSESPPYDVFYGTGKPGSLIVIESAYGRATTEVRDNGGWELKVFFEGAPLGEVIEVHVVDKFEHHKVFEFKHTD